jgi:protein-L-isoaspartate O-methyltransferase
VTGVTVVVGDGTLAVPEHAPYQATVVAAAAPRVPGPLVEQLAPLADLPSLEARAPGIQAALTVLGRLVDPE